MLASMEIGFEFPERLQERNIKFFVVKPRVQRGALVSDKLDQTCIGIFSIGHNNVMFSDIGFQLFWWCYLAI